MIPGQGRPWIEGLGVAGLVLALAAGGLPASVATAATTRAAGPAQTPAEDASPEADASPDAGTETPADAPAAEDEHLAEAQRLYQEGQVLYSAADYPGAIDKFTAALALATSQADSFDAEVRGRLLFNLATAHDRAFNTERDGKHLRVALELFGRIVDEAGVHGYSESLVEQADESRARVQARLDEFEQSQKPDPEPVVVQPEPEPEPEPEPGPPPGRGLTIAGAAVAGLGVAASGIWIAGAVGASRATDDIYAASSVDTEDARVDAIDRGLRANTLVIAGAAVSGALVAAGVAMLVVGQLKNKRHASTMACAPVTGPRLAGVGLGCRLRF